MEKSVKNFQVVEIIEDKSGSNTNRFTDEEEQYITVVMEEKLIKGQPYSGAQIGYTFQHRTERGWIKLLDQLREEKIKLEDLPPFAGFIHETSTAPFFRLIKNEKGELEPMTFTEGEDKGKPVVFSKYRMLLPADADPKAALADYLGSSRVKLLKQAIAEGTNIPEYKNSKSADLVELVKLQDAPESNEEVKD